MYKTTQWVMSPIIQFGVVFLLIFWYLSRKQKELWIKNFGMSLVAAFGVISLIWGLYIGFWIITERGMSIPSNLINGPTF